MGGNAHRRRTDRDRHQHRRALRRISHRRGDPWLGVLAVVAAGLFLSRKSSQFFSPAVRIQVYAVWGALTFVLNGLVFLLIGLQLPLVLAGIREYGLGTLALSGAAFSALVIALRLAWVFPGARFAYFIRRQVLHQRGPF